MIELILPWPPTVNHYKKIGRIVTTSTGKLYQMRVNSDKTKRFYFEVWMSLRKLVAREGTEEGTIFDSSAKIFLEVDAYPPDKRKRDLSNILKVLEDSLQHGGLYPDDFQIARLLVQRMDIITGGQVIVRASELK